MLKSHSLLSNHYSGRSNLAQHHSVPLFWRFALKHVVWRLFLSLFLVLDLIALQLVSDWSFALNFGNTSLLARSICSELVVIELINSLEHLSGLVKLSVVPAQLVNSDLPLSLVSPLLIVKSGIRRQGLVSKQK